MTGPGPGKVEIPASVYVCKAKGCEKVEATVYVHIRGFSRARVTHIDVEAPGLEDKIGRETYVRVVFSGHFLRLISLDKSVEVRIVSPELERVSRGRRVVSWGFIGLKAGGFYIGFRKEIVDKLERSFRGRVAGTFFEH